MKLAVFSHKPCWRSAASPSGYATDGGFPMQMRAISELFDATVLLVPADKSNSPDGEMALSGHDVRSVSLSHPGGKFNA